MRKYTHLFFDLDHTLWDFDTNAKVAMSELFKEYELDKLISSDFIPFFEKYLSHNKILWARYQNGYISADELKWRRMWRTLLEFKIGDEALSKSLSARYLEILPTKETVFPYTKEILKYLQQKDYALHLITNGFEKTQWKKIKNSNIDHFFTHVITSESSNSMKPEKEIFEYAINKVNANVSDCIMIGDNLDADIKGALDFGMDCIFVNHVEAITEIKPTYTITQLRELEDIFK